MRCEWCIADYCNIGAEEYYTTAGDENSQHIICESCYKSLVKIRVQKEGKK